MKRRFFIADIATLDSQNNSETKTGHSFRKISIRAFMFLFKSMKKIIAFFAVIILICSIHLMSNKDEKTRGKLMKSFVAKTNSSIKYVKEKSLVDLMDEASAALYPALDDNDISNEKSNKEFKFYVYDNLPEQYIWQNVSKCIEGGGTECDWGASICIENRTSGPKYTKRRFNYNGDVVLSKIFSEYEGPSRTYDANKATLFIVPYPHSGHCECRKGTHRCSKIFRNQEIEQLFEQLIYLNDTTKNKHLFFYTQINSGYPLIMKSPLLLTLSLLRSSRLLNCGDIKKKCGHIAIPYVNTDPDYQPDKLKALDEKWWISRPRKFSIFAMLGTEFSGSRVRAQFVNEADSLFGSEIGGLPVEIINLKNFRNILEPKQLMKMYRNSTFCPCLRGDTPNQKRFFDVIMSGCIPVVMKYYSKEDGYPSHFCSRGTSIRRTYPFAKGSFYGNPNIGIDYESMVVGVNGTCGLPCMKPTLEAVMKNETELHRLRWNLMKTAHFFSYGMEHNTLKHVDAVTAILVRIRHHLEN